MQHEALLGDGGMDAIGPFEALAQLLLAPLVVGDVAADAADRVGVAALVAQRERERPIDPRLPLLGRHLVHLDGPSGPQHQVVALAIGGYRRREDLGVQSPDDQLAATAEAQLEGAIDELEAMLEILDGDRIGHVVQDRAQAPLAHAQRQVRRAPRRDVLEHAHDVRRSAAVVDHLGAGVHPHGRSVASDVALLAIEGLRLARGGAAGPVDVGREIVRVGQPVERRGEQLILLVAEQPAVGRVDPQPATVEVDHRHPDRGVRERRGQQLPRGARILDRLARPVTGLLAARDAQRSHDRVARGQRRDVNRVDPAAVRRLDRKREAVQRVLKGRLELRPGLGREHVREHAAYRRHPHEPESAQIVALDEGHPKVAVKDQDRRSGGSGDRSAAVAGDVERAWGSDAHAGPASNSSRAGAPSNRFAAMVSHPPLARRRADQPFVGAAPSNETWRPSKCCC